MLSGKKRSAKLLTFRLAVVVYLCGGSYGRVFLTYETIEIPRGRHGLSLGSLLSQATRAGDRV